MTTAAAGVLSTTLTCHVFGANADGYGRADAIEALYLKTLSDALRGNDPIRPVIRGMIINANGRTPGITLPSSLGQEAVIAQACGSSGLDQLGTWYIECHGTGTPVGVTLSRLLLLQTSLESLPRLVLAAIQYI